MGVQYELILPALYPATQQAVRHWCTYLFLSANVGLTAIVVVPYVKNEVFVGRASVLQFLKSQLGFGSDDGTKPRQTVALHGLGGVGYVYHP